MYGGGGATHMMGSRNDPTFSSTGYLVMGLADQQPGAMSSGDWRSPGGFLSSPSFLLMF